ncbi:MAG: NAD-dependent epimerase/dehydratase family protein [Candidatus Endonucleobacter sp. (ex Gigantidas childressi)]|nr:NAD-dependent epimerase/dehydratase family protein [Candidatus Endonucleobacter sp. (ex Gigantidas childressi)]
MNILITGSAGFIGKGLICCLSKHHKVVEVVRKIESPESKVNKIFQVDIKGGTDWSELLPDTDAIIHLAAVAHNKSNDLSYIDSVNVKGTVNLAVQAANSGVKRFIFISSIGVLGNKTKNGLLLNELSQITAKSEYTKSKAKAEVELLKIAKEIKLEVVIIRPVLVYGPNAPLVIWVN